MCFCHRRRSRKTPRGRATATPFTSSVPHIFTRLKHGRPSAGSPSGSRVSRYGAVETSPPGGVCGASVSRQVCVGTVTMNVWRSRRDPRSIIDGGGEAARPSARDFNEESRGFWRQRLLVARFHVIEAFQWEPLFVFYAGSLSHCCPPFNNENIEESKTERAEAHDSDVKTSRLNFYCSQGRSEG